MGAVTDITVKIMVDDHEYEADVAGEYEDHDCALVKDAVLSKFEDIVEPVYRADQTEREIYEGTCEIVRTQRTFVRWRYYLNADPSEETDGHDPAWKCQSVASHDQAFSDEL